MDPISQGAIGAALPQSFSNKKELRWATYFGFLSGLLPDIDVIFRSDTDPLLFLEYHRGFTHSLIFIPFGGLIATLVLWNLFRRPITFKRAYIYCTLGYATHGLLDACTSYGTRLLWPFNDVRVAWDNIGIIDPLATIPLFLFVLISRIKSNITWARVGLFYFISYLILGVVQRERAQSELFNLAKSRGHTIERSSVRPTIFNNILWRSVYEFNGKYFADAIRIPWFGRTKIYIGESTEKIRPENFLDKFQPDSRQYKDILRFNHFSDNYLATYPDRPYVIGDFRYALLPQSIIPLWGIRINPLEPNTHVDYITFRQTRSRDFKKYWSLILGR